MVSEELQVETVLQVPQVNAVNQVSKVPVQKLLIS
jgi:hypothetical protein